jgi:phosphomannomutase
MKDYKKLQNGSDIRGVAVDGIAGEPVNLTREAAADIAIGFTKWLADKKNKPAGELVVAIGRDPRISGVKLLSGLTAGFASAGVKVLDCGLATTPAMFMATVFDEIKCDGSIMITASHLPYNRNGFKFFTRDGGLDKADIKAILEAAANSDQAPEISGDANTSEEDIMTLYCNHLKQLIIDGVGTTNVPLEGMKIVVDAGNGGGGFYADRVLAPLGADVSDSQFLEPDGMFPNHQPNPEDKAAMKAISQQVKNTGADFGIIFDTDVDRSAAVDSQGREIARNGIVAMAAALVAEEHPGTTVVTDSITSNQLTSFIEKELGLKHLRFKRGYKNVINKSIQLNVEGIDSQLAIETSGHAALKENYFLDDGAYLATKIVIKAAKLSADGKKIDSVIESLEEPADEREIRIPITCEEFGEYGDKVLADLEVVAEKDDKLTLVKPNYEGVRINFTDGWCLLRKSLHDPILPMNMAADKAGGCDEIEEFMIGFLKGYDKLKLD